MTNPTKIVQLSVLTFAVAISQAFRTVPAITINGIAGEMNAGFTALALFGGIFSLSFALMQIPVRLALTYSASATRWLRFRGSQFWGSNLCLRSQHQLAFSGTDPDRDRLCAGIYGPRCIYIQALACCAFRRHLRACLALSGGGMLLSATLLAWFIDRWSWRSGFVVLTAMS